MYKKITIQNSITYPNWQLCVCYFLLFSLSKLALDKLALTKLALAKLALAMAKLAVELSSLSPANFFKALTITSLPQFDIFPFDFVFEKK